MKSRRAIESLHHFFCAHCGKWWTVGDAPRAKKEWHCPWCGKKNRYPSAKIKKT